ncbi:MAG: cytochrome P450 [Acidimicrobiia bacterium]
MTTAWPPSAEVQAWPYDFYAELRAERGFRTYRDVHPGIDYALVARWADVDEVLRRPDDFRQHVPGIPEWDAVLALPYPEEPRGRLEPRPVPLSDGEDHRVKRRWHRDLVHRDRLAEARGWVGNVVDELLDDLVGRGPVDFRDRFADVLPIRVISRILDLPDQDAPRLMGWARAFSAVQNDPTAPAEAVEAGRRAMRERAAYARALFDERRRTPRDDFLSELLARQTAFDEGLVDVNYLVKQADNLLHAGHHTTSAMLANAMVDLCTRPGVQDRVRADPSLVPAMLEESMRLNTVIPWAMRMCGRDTEVGGTPVRAGTVVWLVWAAANRDPAVFEDPDVFRFDRPHLAVTHLTFGRGIHLCLGAPLARLEGALAYEHLLARTTRVRLDAGASDLTPVPSLMSSRTPTRLVVELGAA